MASSTYWTNGRIVALTSAKEMFGAPRTAEKDKLDKPIYPPQPASEMVGCSLMNSVVTF